MHTCPLASSALPSGVIVLSASSLAHALAMSAAAAGRAFALLGQAAAASLLPPLPGAACTGACTGYENEQRQSIPPACSPTTRLPFLPALLWRRQQVQAAFRSKISWQNTQTGIKQHRTTPNMFKSHFQLIIDLIMLEESRQADDRSGRGQARRRCVVPLRPSARLHAEAHRPNSMCVWLHGRMS